MAEVKAGSMTGRPRHDRHVAPEDSQVVGRGSALLTNVEPPALDYIQIQQVLARYSRGIDRMDRELILSVYWEDAYDSHGVCEGNREAFADWIGENMTRYAASNHMLGQSLIEIEADHADCETYFAAFHHLPGQDGDLMVVVGGRYHDRFERRNGEWRIHRRRVLFDWMQETPMVDALPRLDLPRRNEVMGRRDRADPSYRSPAFTPPATS